MIKNKSTLGLSNFLQEFYEDCHSGIVKGWWNEKYNRRNEDLRLYFKDVYLKNTYDLVEYIKDNYKDILQEDIDAFKKHVSTTFAVVNIKRVYFWEVEIQEKVSNKIIFSGDDDGIQQEEKEEEVVDDVVQKPIPDFEHAKSLDPDKQALKEYAATFGIKVDGRKEFPDMIKSFQGKYHATKHKM